MKIRMDEKGVETLRTFAEVMPKVLANLNDAMDTLMGKYHAVAEMIGPHAEQFLEMLRSIKRVEAICSADIEELSKKLDCTADLIESYIKHGASYGTVTLGRQDIQARYHGEANRRLYASGTHPAAKALYEQYAGLLRIVDYDSLETPYYSPRTKGIVLNAMADLHNPFGNLSTYFHEAGHMLDDCAGNGHTWLSSDPDFGKYLRQDVDAYITKTMLTKHCEMQEAYDIISEEVSGCWNAGVSDIFESLTNCQCRGDWGHGYKYWRKDASRIEKEAFANMFEASIGDERKLAAMKAYFPRAYEKFESIIRSI